MAGAPLRNGRTYAAKLRLSGLETLASTSMIAEQLRGAGFRAVEVYESEADLPMSWPANLRGAGSGVRFARGEWGGPDTSRELPSQVVAYVEIGGASPSPSPAPAAPGRVGGAPGGFQVAPSASDGAAPSADFIGHACLMALLKEILFG